MQGKRDLYSVMKEKNRKQLRAMKEWRRCGERDRDCIHKEEGKNINGKRNHSK